MKEKSCSNLALKYDLGKANSDLGGPRMVCRRWFNLTSILFIFCFGCASPGINGEKKILAASSSSVPSWVKDSRNHDQKELIKNFDDKLDSPMFYYLVSQAHVDNENLVPSCYNFARANAANELASSVNQEVNATVSSQS